MNNLIKTSVLIFTLLILLTSCDSDNSDTPLKNNTILEKSKIENASLKQKIDYTNYYLLEVGKTISKLSKNKEFTLSLFNSINEKRQENGNSQVFVKDLISVINSNNKIEFTKKQKESLDKALSAFYDLDGRDWNPAIYISNFDEEYQKIQNKAYDSTKPLIVPVVYEDDDELVEDRYRVYQEDENGVLEDVGFDISESETPNYNRMVYYVLIGDDSGSNGDGSSNTTYPDEPNIFLRGMRVKWHKESIGRSEVEVKTKLQRIEANGTYTTMSDFDYQYSYRRRWIRHEDWRGLNSNMTKYSSQGITPESGTIISWVIFEWDCWPAPEKTRPIEYPLPNGQTYTRTVTFRSWQSQYDKGALSSLQSQNQWNRNTSSIYYELEKKYTY